MPPPFVILPGAAVEDRRPVPLPAAAQRRMRSSRRMRDGDRVVVGDGAGLTVEARLDDGVAVPVREPVRHERPEPPLRLAQALPKGRKMDDVIRVCTELGVDAVIPVAARRSVVRLDGDRACRAVERWRQVAVAACEQSRRAWAPRIDRPVPVDRLGARLGGDGRCGGVLLVAHPTGDTTLRAALTEDPDGPVALAVGPEGGWDEEELRVLADGGARAVALGPTVLRTEHAGAALVAITAYERGRMRPVGAPPRGRPPGD